MTAKRYLGAPHLMPVHEPAERTRVEVRWDGAKQDTYLIAGGVEHAVAKVLADYQRRAQCAALAKGQWEVVAGERSESFMVD